MTTGGQIRVAIDDRGQIVFTAGGPSGVTFAAGLAPAEAERLGQALLALAALAPVVIELAGSEWRVGNPGTNP